MNLTVIRKDGTIYDLNDLGIKTRDFIISSPEYRTEYEEIEGADGVIELGTTIGARILTGNFFFTASDVDEYPTLRNEIFRIFLSRDSFYLIDDREPNRKWEVKCNSVFKPDQILQHGSFDLDFICPKGYAESIDSTLNMAIVQLSGSTVQKYKHTSTTFEIYNESNVSINPRKLPLIIKYLGASSNLQIKNLTTGDTWSYTGTTISNDTLEINGTRSLKNGVSVFSNTNRKLISLNEGWNEFQLIGTSGTIEITFDFYFYTI
jgi:predicted phage tail component-like protein